MNQTLPRTAAPDSVIAPFWDDLDLTNNPTTARVYFQTQGIAPDRMFVVEWYDVPHISDGSSRFTFQSIFYESPGEDDVKFQYFSMVDGNSLFADGRSASVGLENLDGTDGLEYSFGLWGSGPQQETRVLRPIFDGLAIRFTEDFLCLHHGDVNFNGSVTSRDAQSAFWIALGMVTPTPSEECAADCNGDGSVTQADAQQIFGTIFGGPVCIDTPQDLLYANQ